MSAATGALGETTGTEKSVLSVNDLLVEFPGVRALDHVDFALQEGEVRALMGKNGAGKSTLVRVLSGAQAPNQGQILIDGQPVTLDNPAEAQRRGIATVFQELTVIPGLTVAENISLGHWQTGALGRIDRKTMRQRAEAALELLGEHLDVNAPAGRLSIAQQQLVEIAGALSHDPRVLILDEPTSSLPRHEVDLLLELVRRLAQRGVSVIYVSHRIDEIGRVADSVTVIRDGRVIDTLGIKEADVETVSRLMVGAGLKMSDREVSPLAADAAVALGAAGLEDGHRLHGIDLEVRTGEILGIAGLLGAGRTELLEALAGHRRIKAGEVTVAGSPIRRPTTPRMIDHGVTLVPENRKAEGLVLIRPVRDNLVMSCHNRIAKGGIVDRRAENEIAQTSRRSLDIKVHDVGVEAQTLSGGNQQKVVIGRCLNANTQVLLLDEPTRGVDVHAKQQIYDLIRELAGTGRAVIVVSSEYEELLLLCHRVLVLHDGQITEELDPDRTTLDVLLARTMRSD